MSSASHMPPVMTELGQGFKLHMLIRPFQTTDAKQLSALFHASVRRAGLHHYSAEQVEAWSPTPPDPELYIQRSLDGRVFLVAVSENGAQTGYGDLEMSGHIDHLYCHADFIGKGIGSALYRALEKAAHDQGIKTLFVEASEGARILFEKNGFIVQKRNDFMLKAVPIHNYQMSKQLA